MPKDENERERVRGYMLPLGMDVGCWDEILQLVYETGASALPTSANGGMVVRAADSWTMMEFLGYGRKRNHVGCPRRSRVSLRVMKRW